METLQVRQRAYGHDCDYIFNLYTVKLRYIQLFVLISVYFRVCNLSSFFLPLPPVMQRTVMCYCCNTNTTDNNAKQQLSYWLGERSIKPHVA